MLGLNGSVSNVVIFSELGKFPIRILCIERILKYWLRFISHYVMKCNEARNLLNTLGLNHRPIWELQRKLHIDNCNTHFCVVKQRIRYLFIEPFFIDIGTNMWLQIYSCFKESFEYEKHLEMLNSKEWNALCRFHCSGHNLMIEKGRYLNIARSLRLCHFCDYNVLEDECHFSLVCPLYRDLRRKCFENYNFSCTQI